ncbi:hypothetical protein [Fontivita pretiosa]|uniref:hypothetical protein n=1 Tax=Fontivita pretiosa TaxID=2989684 RepID=UPI003D16D0DE
MMDVTEFNRLTKELQSKKSYKRDELLPVRSLFKSLAIDQKTARASLEGLSALRWQDAVSLLAEKWAQIPTELRYIFLRWRWEGKEKEAAIPACLAMAAAIYADDAASAAEFVAGAIATARSLTNGKSKLLKGLRQSWLKIRNDAAPAPFQQFTWQSLEPSWRWELIEALVQAARVTPRQDKGRAAKVDHRKVVQDWLASLKCHHAQGSPEAIRLEELEHQLSCAASPLRTSDHAAAAEPTVDPATHATPASQGGALVAPTLDSEPSAPQSTVVEAPPQRGEARSNADHLDHFDRVASPRDRVQLALDSPREQTQSYHEAASREIAALERRLQQAEYALKVAEADIGQLRRDVQAEHARLLASQSEAAKYRDELDASRRRIVDLEGELEQLREKLRMECERSDQLRRHAEDERLKHLDILEHERQEARRLLGQKIADAIRPEVQKLRDVESSSEGGASFARLLIDNMLNQLRALEVPIQG